MILANVSPPPYKDPEEHISLKCCWPVMKTDVGSEDLWSDQYRHP